MFKPKTQGKQASSNKLDALEELGLSTEGTKDEKKEE
jgi:hypothetical protein